MFHITNCMQLPLTSIPFMSKSRLPIIK